MSSGRTTRYEGCQWNLCIYGGKRGECYLYGSPRLGKTWKCTAPRRCIPDSFSVFKAPESQFVFPTPLGLERLVRILDCHVFPGARTYEGNTVSMYPCTTRVGTHCLLV